MAKDLTTGGMTAWNCPNYAGELFTAGKTKTPFLAMAGSLTGGMVTDNFEFPTAVLFDYPAATQPSITETASLTAPTASFVTREQEKNVVQIFQDTISMSYVKQSNSGRMSGLNTAGQQPNPKAEYAWQLQRKLDIMARNVEHTFLNGKYKLASSADTANQTRGMIELCSTGTTIKAGSEAKAPLTKELLDTLYRTMADNGAYFDNIVCFCNSFQKQAITNIYEKQLGYNAPAPRNVGGMSVDTIYNDFFQFGIVYDPFMPTDTLLFADMAHVAPVFQAVPGKGVLFTEPLAKTGASDSDMLFGQIGLAHGPKFLHATITNLADGVA